MLFIDLVMGDKEILDLKYIRVENKNNITMWKIAADVEMLLAREPPLNILHYYPQMVKVGFEDHFVQVIYLCSTSEKENKSI